MGTIVAVHADNVRMEKKCHHITGECDQGCMPGYKEPTCEMGTVCKSYLNM